MHLFPRLRIVEVHRHESLSYAHASSLLELLEMYAIDGKTEGESAGDRALQHFIFTQDMDGDVHPMEELMNYRAMGVLIDPRSTKTPS
ncbi:hypothetical protein CPB83DRAFT_853508 [Crepidotus variabilis]|uniref:Uncharacterized protein n=1 Tax=Crepidotus variabilis TaxID=179855 RepID=A0A9P6EHF0_9AGAR|nr:hypothetical protein CPB83DRAFT_853508 [Crepidotus variabilis]